MSARGLLWATAMRTHRPNSLHAVLAVVWTVACGATSSLDGKLPSQSPYIVWYPEHDPIVVGEPVPIVNVRTEGMPGCQKEWLVEPQHPGAVTIEPAPTRGLQLTAHQAGVYFVTLRCGGLRATHRIEAFVPSVKIDSLSSPLPESCLDSAITDDGKRLLCVRDGVTVYDLDTLRGRGRTNERVPGLWGIDTHGDLFATATTGCGSYCPSGGDISAGTRLYRIQPDGSPTLLSVLTTERSNEVAFVGSQLFVTTDSNLYKFDLSDPVNPRREACVRGKFAASLPVPMPADVPGSTDVDLLDVSPAQLRPIKGGDLGMSCSVDAPTAGVLPLSAESFFLPIVDVSFIPDSVSGRAHAFLIAARAGTPNHPQVVGGYHIVDLRDPSQPKLVFQSDNEAYGTVAFDQRLLIASAGRVAVFDTAGLAIGEPPRALGVATIDASSSPMRMYHRAGTTWLISDRHVWTLSLRSLRTR